LQSLGPGLLYAGASVGVSHLVQSTRAGAEYGTQLIWAVILANVLKYPFFEYGPRYATLTGRSLLEGYNRLGRPFLLLFGAITLVSMVTVQAGVTLVTAGLAQQITGINLEGWAWSGILLLFSLLILAIGQYATLDKAMKVIILLLTASTLLAFVSSLSVEKNMVENPTIFSFSNPTDALFLIALMGWMPAPLDISVWHSLWTLEKNKNIGRQATLKESMFDFHLGYWGTMILALLFVGLGYLVLFGTGTELSSNGSTFAGQLISVYTNSIGSWAYIVIAVAAFTTMLSTTLTCLDAFPRTLQRTTQIIANPEKNNDNPVLYWIWITITAIGAMIILVFFADNMKTMVSIATITSFLTAPLVAILNFVVVQKDLPKHEQPNLMLKIISWLGIIYLTGFSVYFLWMV
jgi:Mn2+/Fe2+ NRAMP family transporter